MHHARFKEHTQQGKTIRKTACTAPLAKHKHALIPFTQL